MTIAISLCVKHVDFKISIHMKWATNSQGNLLNQLPLSPYFMLLLLNNIPFYYPTIFYFLLITFSY